MRIAVAGATGFIGSCLCKEFLSREWEVIVLSRNDLYSVNDALANKIKGADIVINLAGAPIARRWNKKVKKNIYDSRIITTRNIVAAIHQLEIPPQLFISTSASGIFDQGGPYTETNVLLSSSFLGKLCQDWEREAYLAEDRCRLVIFRLGVVLDRKGGILPRLLPIFKSGFGGRTGRGDQYFPWISMTDLVRAYFLVIENNSLKGTFNLTAPQIITNQQFTQSLAEVLHRPAFIPVPTSLLYLMFGEGSTVVIGGQAVVPQRLLDLGFSFHFPSIKQALSYLLEK
jgi:uncharacterized protein (TIGR01777 family)